MSEEKAGAKQELDDMRAHEEEAARRASGSDGSGSDNERLSDDEDQPKPAGPMGGANLGGAS